MQENLLLYMTINVAIFGEVSVALCVLLHAVLLLKLQTGYARR